MLKNSFISAPEKITEHYTGYSKLINTNNHYVGKVMSAE